jgi:uncharacterized RDD family membrane protein YckC
VTLSDDFLQVDTPENVVFGYELAGVGTRFLAGLIDTLIILVMEIGVYMVLGVVASAFIYTIEASGIGGWIIAALGFLGFVLLWGYYIFFEVLWNGQSPGKRLLGARVMRRDGTPITLAESLIRNVVRLVDFLPNFYIVGIITMVVDKQSRRVGDLAAGTVVVFDRVGAAPPSLDVERPAPEYQISPDHPAFAAPVENLTGEDVILIEEFLRRRRTLVNRPQMARRIIDVIQTRLEQPLEPMTLHEIERWLATVVEAYYRRRE